ncbi:MAG: tetratricopeptide repeat protein [Deltaproteobacteria bacterium]|nr:tetratricopeptide repeat protein [Deltaproteobacteria bacterium]
MASVAPDEKAVLSRARWWWEHRPAHVAAGLLALVVGAVFANTLWNGFHLDDFYRVKDNPGIQQFSRPWVHFTDPRTMSTLERIAAYRPLLPLSLSVNYAIAGDSLPGYHLGNMLLHGVAAYVVYLLLLELLLFWCGRFTPAHPRVVALGAALAFAVHPVSGILVNYICARDQALMQVFLGACLLAHVRMRRMGTTAGRWAAALGLLALALLSKTDGVVAPALIVVFEATLGGGGWLRPRTWAWALPSAGVVGAFFAFEKYVLGFSDFSTVMAGRGERWSYAFTQARLHLFHYLPNFAWPLPIRQDPQVPPATSLLEPGVLAGGLFILGSIGLAVALSRRAPPVAFLVLAYWIPMFPTSGVLPLHHLAVDYRPYPSSPFLFLLLGLGLARVRSGRRAGAVAAAALVWWAGCSVYLNTTWRSEASLWRYSVLHGGGPLAHLNLGMATADLAERRALLEKALEMAPGYILVEVNLGRARVAQGEVEEGLALLRTAVGRDPGGAQTRYWYAVTLSELGRTREAAAEARRAAELDGRNATYQHRAARELQVAGDYAGSLVFLERLEQVAPGYADAGFLRGFALQMTGKLEDAVAVYRRFLAAQPRHVQATFNLGHALMTLGRCDEAAPVFERTLALQPGYEAARLHLQTCRGANAR